MLSGESSTGRRQYAAGTLPVPTNRLGRLIRVGEPLAAASRDVAEVVVYARVSSGRGKKFLALLRDPRGSTIVVEHPDRFARFGAEYVEAALAAQGRRLLVVDPVKVDLVRDVAEILTSVCARLYGRRDAANRARQTIDPTGLGEMGSGEL
jgi:predicted site-specific integrase-resolvase